jgi:hypothetical protein
MKLFIWDFDKTFFFTPEMEEGKKVWVEKKGVEWAYNGWWSKRETLDMDVFDIQMNKWIYDEYSKYQDENCVHYLVTGRVTPLYEQVKAVVDKHNLKFKDIFCNDISDTLTFKLRVFNELVEKHKPSELYIYDDRQTHLPIFIEKLKFDNVNVSIIDSVKQMKIN